MVKTKTTKSPRTLKKAMKSPVVTSTPMTGKGNKKRRRLSSGGRESTDEETPKRRRTHPGTRALKEIRFYQRSTHFLIPKLSFCRLVKETINKSAYRQDFRIQSKALEALQEAAEAFLIRFLEDTNLCAIHARRVTIFPKDMNLVKMLKHEQLFNALEE
uniref:Histone CENP-A n=1 Tax=Hydractinia echinata TaxID=3283270 RepID=A0A1B3IR05_HYDEC|nr:histone CENP-A [Hydractinia echinata]